MTTTANTDRAEAQSVSTHVRAVTQARYGNSEVLHLDTIERPTPEADEVLIEVHAAGIDRGTEHLMTGTPYLIRLVGYGLTKPKNSVPGLDVSGVIVEVGSAVTRFEIGDAVFGIANGSFADYATAKQEKLVHKPENVGFEDAGASAVSGITALQALTDVGQLESGQRVLVIGASGGVGSFAVQLAKALGATVHGVAGTSNLELVRSLGADHVYDHRQTDLADIDERYDLVLDIGGRNSVHKLRGVLAKTGTLVIVGGEDGNRFTGGIGRQLLAMALSPFVAQRLTTFISKEHHSFMERLAEYLVSGDVVPSIGARFELDDTQQAMHLLETGQASGKSVIVVKEPRTNS